LSGLDEALDNAREAIALWMEEAIADNRSIPPPSRLETLQQRAEFAGWVWAVVQVDPAWADERAERVNITLPRRVLALLDNKARLAGETRSAYIAQLALQAHAP